MPSQRVTCKECKGTGRVASTPRDDPDDYREILCLVCKGYGVVDVVEPQPAPPIDKETMDDLADEALF